MADREGSGGVGKLSSAQLEFLAEAACTVRIVPAARLPALRLASGPLPALVPGLPVAVPLWVALALRKRGLCQVEVPAWLAPDALRPVQEQERAEPAWAALPFHYMEIKAALVRGCAAVFLPMLTAARAEDSFAALEESKRLLDDISGHRQNKLRDGLLAVDGPINAILLENLGAMEVNSMRPFLVPVMNAFRALAVPSVSSAPAPGPDTLQSQVDDDADGRSLRRGKRARQPDD